MKNRLTHWLVCILLILVVTGCSNPGPGPAVTPDASQPAGTAAATGLEETTGVPTAPPTETPSPTAPPPLAVLLAPEGASASLVEQLEPELKDLAEQAGLRFETRVSLASQDLQAEAVRIVVVLPPDPGLEALAAASPETQFLAVTLPTAQAGGNISVVQAAGGRPDIQAFVAGYLSAVITTDWRVGVISEAGTGAGAGVQTAFKNGVVYYCGLCRPAYPPFPLTGYPLAAEFTPGAGEASWQASLSEFVTWQVDTVYVYAETPDEELLGYLANQGFNLISAGDPVAGAGSRWIASLSFADPSEAVRELWPALLRGEGRQQVELPLALENVNPELLSPGRKLLVEKMLADLLAGLIDTGATPQAGE